MKQLSLALISGILSSAAAHAACVPVRESVKYPQTGLYHRVHPSGNYVLYTESEEVKIVDITRRNAPKVIETSMKKETYPVEGMGGGWDLLASPYDNKAMNYYQFKDILAKGPEASSVYKDPDNDEYYHSSAELPGSTAASRKVRTLLYGNTYRDYTMEKDAKGNFTKVKPGPKGQQACLSFSNIGGPDRALTAEDTKKVAALRLNHTKAINELNLAMQKLEEAEAVFYKSARTAQDQQKVTTQRDVKNVLFARMEALNAEIDKFKNGSKYLKITARAKELEQQYIRATSPEQQQKIQEQLQAAGMEIDAYESFKARPFQNPVLSKDGTLVASNTNNTIDLFRILPEGRCERVGTVGLEGSKVSFSYPEKGKLPRIVFTASQGAANNYRNAVVTFDPNTNETTTLTDASIDTFYPGFTRDGRVVYAHKNGFEIIDPIQIKNGANARGCIQGRVGAVTESAPASPDPRERDGEGSAE